MTPVGGPPATGAETAYEIGFDRIGKDFRLPSGRTVHAVEEVTGTVPAGQFVSIVGPSGCGKSTLLAIVAGLEPASAGAVTVGGQP
ncbi:MAG: ATP-binding cassette domain-containing protein, partial [Natronosporangium sp.]